MENVRSLIPTISSYLPIVNSVVSPTTVSYSAFLVAVAPLGWSISKIAVGVTSKTIDKIKRVYFFKKDENKDDDQESNALIQEGIRELKWRVMVTLVFSIIGIGYRHVAHKEHMQKILAVVTQIEQRFSCYKQLNQVYVSNTDKTLLYKIVEAIGPENFIQRHLPSSK